MSDSGATSVELWTLILAGIAAFASVGTVCVSLWSARTERYIDRERWAKQWKFYADCLVELWTIRRMIGLIERQLLGELTVEDQEAPINIDRAVLKSLDEIRRLVLLGGLLLSPEAANLLESFVEEFRKVMRQSRGYEECYEVLWDLIGPCIEGFTTQAKRDLRIPR